MNRFKSLQKLALALALASGGFAAHAQINLNISIAPPAAQYEIVPTIAPGYVWAPGYWGWSGERHVWMRGRPIMQREGFLWTPDRWEQRDRYYYRTAGHWQRDHDFKPVKMKKEKKHKDRDNHGNHGGGKHKD